jgi:putative ABC transport system ATP-binding protein
MGREVAATTIELFGDLKPDNPFFDQLDYMAAEDIPLYRAALGRIANHPMKEVSEDDRRLILKLPFAYVESKNRLDLLDDDLKARIVDARRALRAQLEAMDPCPVNFFDPDRYIPSATVIDNVLFGRVSASVAEANLKVADAIRNLLGEMQMADEIFRIGLSFNIGSGGKRLSESQRQRLQLARALLKKPDFLIVNQALNTLDSRAQKAAIDMVLAKASGRDGNRFGVIWAPMNPAFATLFPRVLVFERGVLTADGPPGQLAESSAAYRELVGA